MNQKKTAAIDEITAATKRNFLKGLK